MQRSDANFSGDARPYRPLTPILRVSSAQLPDSRPYRAPGFVVRREALGEKQLVHNYGHGGGGITLSWGSSKLAADLGLPGHSGPVAVIGSGIMGLSTARLVQEAGFPVTIYAAALPPDTTSNIAGGQFNPSTVFSDDEATPAFMAQFTKALGYSWRRFQIMVGDEYGVRWLPTYVQRDNFEPKLLETFPPVNRLMRPQSILSPWGCFCAMTQCTSRLAAISGR